jgi:hypothetical protein
MQSVFSDVLEKRMKDAGKKAAASRKKSAEKKKWRLAGIKARADASEK